MSASSPTLTSISDDDARDLLVLLSGLPDPRRTGGRLHPVGYVLAVTVIAFTSPAFAHLVGAAAWAGAASATVLRRLGARPDPFTGAISAPSEATIRRVINGVDPHALGAAFSQWLAAREQLDPRQDDRPDDQQVVRGVAVDGKAVRGARGADGSMPYLLGAATHGDAIMLGQVQVPDKTSEIGSVPVVLELLQAAGRLDENTVITVDALHTIRATATAIRATGAHYLMTVKANTPTLLIGIRDYLADPKTAVSEHQASNRGHGRTEQRFIRTAALVLDDPTNTPARVDFPDAAQVAQIVRYRGGLDGQRTSKEVVHAITSLPPARADTADLAGLIRGHWSIENGVHHVRDVTFGEDASRTRTGHGPVVLATIRNIITAGIRLSGHTNIAAARRAATSNVQTAINWFTTPTERDESSL